jgi:phenylpyruvate tautomerase PptA (4-oxalocrotonate tautomerase family)
MPYLMLQTNTAINQEAIPGKLKALSVAASRALEKPENYVMIALESGTAMMFAGDDSPTAYIELKSLGLPEDKTKAFSEALCSIVEQELGIPQNRIYIEFCGPERHMWGWNGATF